VRLLPPLVISDEELSEGVRRLGAACKQAETVLGSNRKVAAA